MQFAILGPLRVTGDDGRAVALGGTRPAAVLAMLLLRANEVVSSDRLIEDLWDGKPPPTAAKALQVYVSRLRKALSSAGDDGGRLSTRPSGYVLQVDPADVDALRFEALVAQGCAALGAGAHARASASLRAALALWRGDALADFTYASFAQDPIARFEGKRTEALEAALEAELALGRGADLIPDLKSLVAGDPFNEHTRAQLMLALYRAGRQAEALGVYRAGRRILVDELGIEPGAELRELEQAILEQAPGLAEVVPEREPRRTRAASSFVGYEPELEALEEALEQAIGGRGGVALVAGEPGIGKTRLAEELSAIATARGVQVAWGRSWEAGRAPPLWSWTQVLRELGAPEQLEERKPDEALFRLFDETADFLRRAAGIRPLLIVLDDLHAADASSLSLLGFMATAAPGTPLLVVGTYRDTEVGPDHPLTGVLNALTRTRDCLQLVLTGFTSADTARFVALSSGVVPAGSLAAAIHAESRGNPLFVTELVRLLRAEKRLHELARSEALVLPRGIDQVIARRLEHLSAECRRTLALAAVIGREFDVALLERLGAARGRALAELLDDALAARVVEEMPGVRGRLRFSHELVRGSLYQALPAAERRGTHARIAQEIEALHPSRAGQVLADLAHHYDEALPAGDAVKAARYLALAGDAASALSATHEAASYYARAAQIVKEQRIDAEPLAELQLKLAEQLVLIPDAPAAGAAIDETAALLQEADRSRQARLTIVRAQYSVVTGRSEIDGERIRDVIALFQESGDASAEARAWWALFVWTFVAEARFGAAAEVAERMLACARRAGNRELVAQAMRAVASAIAWRPGPIADAIPRLHALLEAAPDGATEARILVSLAGLEAACGRFGEGRALIARARRALAPAELESVDWAGGTALAQLELLAGNARAAEEAARGECRRGQARGLTGYLASDLTYLVEALVEQGRLDEAAAELERAEAIVTPRDADALLRQARCRASLALARGDLAGAERAIRAALKYGADVESPEMRAESLLRVARILAEAGRDREARAAAQEALQLSEARGHEVFAQRARALVASLAEAQVPA